MKSCSNCEYNYNNKTSFWYCKEDPHKKGYNCRKRGILFSTVQKDCPYWEKGSKEKNG